MKAKIQQFLHQLPLLFLLFLCTLVQISVAAQDCECVEKEGHRWEENAEDEIYDYVTYTGKYRTLFLAKDCDSLVSPVYIEDFFNYGDIFYEVAQEFFGWEFIHPKSLETRVNPSLRGGGTGFGGTGYETIFLQFDPRGYDPDPSQNWGGSEGTVVHEGIHRWDFRGHNYFQGNDIAHPFNAALEDVIYPKMGGRPIGQHVDISPIITNDLAFKRNYKWIWRKYLSDASLDWNSYFGREYTFEELEKLPRPEQTLRIFLQGAPFLSVRVMHGEEGLRLLLAELERRRLEDPNWSMWEIAQPATALDQYVRTFADGLQLDVTPYFEYWKIPLTQAQRNHFAQYPASDKIMDLDGDQYSPLQGDFDDTNPSIYPDAPELADGIDNNQDGQVDELVISESVMGDFPADSKGPEFTLPALIQGQMSSMDDQDAFHLNLSEKTLVNVIYTSLNGLDTCTINDDVQYTMFSAILKRNGNHFISSEIFTGQNNNHWNGYLEAGEYTFQISNDWEETCPGDYELQFYIADETPIELNRDGLSYRTKAFNGLEPDPSFDVTNLRGISESEGLALKTLYEEHQGDTWWDARGWMATDDVCYWFGLGCDKMGLSNLNLDWRRRLTKPLTKDILEALPHLRELRLENADFQGDTLVDAFEHMQNLSMLGIFYNSISGPLPRSISSLPKLWHLDLQGNQFSGTIPTEYSSIPHLKRLYLNNNALEGPLPDSLYLLDQLQVFHFDVEKHCVPNQQVWDWLEAISEVNDRNYAFCEGTTSVRDQVIAARIQLYPNPATRQIKIDVAASESEVVRITVLDLLGKVSIDTDQTELSIDALQAGPYFVHVTLRDGERLVAPLQVVH